MEIKGIAKIIKSEEDYSDIQHGDILFMENASPEIFIHFHKIKAMIIENTSLLSHAAILARENKIPHNIGVKNATSLVKTGEKIIIDIENRRITKCKSF
ncbi:hypothetical protein HNV12_02040 [Methanococcoides sp. SA1]|nr:hypothetical protein [Methanococcoides sp. SA1]